MDIFTVLFYQPIYNFLIILYRLLGDNLGLAIIILALASRLITLPITLRQIKMSASGKEMNAKMKEVKKKYKNDKEKQQAELMKIQSEYLPGQIAGCLPAIIQFILFINVYNVINNLIMHGVESFNVVAYSFVAPFDPSYVLNTSFLGGLIDLKTSAASIGLSNPQVIPYLVLVVLVAITQYYSTKFTMSMTNPMSPGASKEEEKDKKDKKDKDGKDPKAPDDFGSIMQQSAKQTMFLLPVMFAIISFNAPSGLALYWIAQSSFVIIQQFVVKRRKKNQK